MSTTLGGLLVKQLAHELKNYNLYKSFANFFGLEGLTSLEKYYNKRADEELHHSDWIHDYLSDGDYRFSYPTIEANTETWDSYDKPFFLTVDREIQTTQMIYFIYEKAIEEKDFMTASWLLNGLIMEQIEEENTSRMALTIMNTEADLLVKAEKISELLSY